jgi:hypothetical protein
LKKRQPNENKWVNILLIKHFINDATHHRCRFFFTQEERARERERKKKKTAKLIPETSSGLTKNYHHYTSSGRTIELYFRFISNAQFTDCMRFPKQVVFFTIIDKVRKDYTV